MAEYGNLVMVTRARDVEGFPSLLNEMLWRGNFSYRPEYSVYARGRGPGLVDYFAAMFIPQRLVEGEHHSYNLVAHGTSIGMAIQEVAYKAMSLLRQEIPELWLPPFQNFPIQSIQPGVNLFNQPPVSAPLYERRMSELVKAQDRHMRCLRAELRETRRRFNELQHSVDMSVRLGRVPSHVIYGPNDHTVQEMAPEELTYPMVQGINIPQPVQRQPRISNGLRVRRFARMDWSRETVYGGQLENLTHPETDPDDTGSPNAHLLDEFPPFFERAPYGPN
ncbi:unnamed protein product [Urochloa decumbens]|uniref:Uncharacterized protein n=1 Tax=Urochloa decumbens TaxID=240449 RepID=A0ABC8WPN2_9POAL